ncbi:hypothetical protein CLV44_11614 [Marinobacterium halophilum]|uniref:Uncharacterized protein n=1 Tax=Marinobacterium halophilum TaxID=267374 RepID=A0A2P8ET49_9GAMM|nr:hypothetical protein [Marinobacterium halophilum]PSL12656.1 hypothetical protein CLV44_11614 [Marinobacterium halophilum]
MRAVINYLRPNFSIYWCNLVLAHFFAFMLGFIPVLVFGADDFFYASANPDIKGHSAQDTCDAYAEYFISTLVSCGDQDHKVNTSVFEKNISNENGSCNISYDWPICYGGEFSHFSKNGTNTKILKSLCTDDDKLNPSSPCYQKQCPEPGTQAGIEIQLYEGVTMPFAYSINGCECEVEFYAPTTDPDENGLVNYIGTCLYTGAELEPTPGNDPENPGEPPEPDEQRCYYDDGTFAGTVSSNAQCPEGSRPDPEGGDDGGEDPEPCDPATDPSCPVNPPDPDPEDCDPETEECKEPENPGTPGNNVADKGNTEIAQFCRDNPKAIQCAEYVYKEIPDNAKGFFDLDKLDTQIEAGWEDLSDVISQTQADVKRTFDLSLSGGSGLPCFPFISWDGKQYDVCLSQYSDAMGILATVILFLCIVVGIMILLR